MALQLLYSRMVKELYADLSYTSLDELLNSTNVGKEFKVRAIVTEIKGPVVLLSYNWLKKVTIDNTIRKYYDKIGELPLYEVKIQDETGSQHVLKFFQDEEKIVELRQSLKNPVYKDFILYFFIGFQLKDYKIHKIDRGEFIIIAIDVFDADTPYKILQADTDEIRISKQKLKSITSRSSLFDYIKDSLITNLNIQNIKKFLALETALEHTIVQAFSAGIIHNHSGKLHSLLIGPPGTGKKLISESIKALNPVSYQADPMKITMPGLVGSTMRNRDNWISQPGLIPLANNGSFIIQDFHAIPNNLKRQIYGVFSMVMEDGEIADSTSAKQRHPALTSIHIDLNKLSEIYLAETKPFTPSEQLADRQIPLNILTRFDSIVEFKRDAKRQFDVALSMHDTQPKIEARRKDISNEPWIRELRLLVAGAIEKYFEISIPNGVLRYVKEKQNDLYEENKDIIDRLSLLGDYQTRVSTSIHKYLFAIARMNLRDHVIRKDVDQSFGFIKYKFQFIKSVLDELRIPKDWDKPKYDIFNQTSRQEYIKATFAEKEFTVEDIKSTMIEDYGQSVDKRTIYRDASDIGEVVRKIGRTKVYRIKE